jgi:outer membrane lipoprotein-sorting protein
MGTCAFAEDAFIATKQKLASAECVQIAFRSYVRSDVFETVDTLDGKAYIASDNRYRIQLGSDEYLYDKTSLYSYSKENNQVTIQKGDTLNSSNEIQLLTRLDELYESSVITPNEQYRLTKKAGVSDNMPDSVVMTINPAKATVKRLEYTNENGDHTRIDITEQKLLSSCDAKKFLPDYPATVERIKL